jgi:hypothetical protein
MIKTWYALNGMLSILRPSTRLAEEPVISIADWAVMLPPRVAATRTSRDDPNERGWSGRLQPAG